MHRHHQVGRLLLGGHPKSAHVFRQPWQRLRNPVLHLYLRLIRIGAQSKGHGQRQTAVAASHRLHVDHLFHAVDGFFQRGGDGFRDGLGVGARIARADQHAGRHDLRVLADRQHRDADQTNHEDDDRQHRGKDRPVDKET